MSLKCVHGTFPCCLHYLLIYLLRFQEILYKNISFLRIDIEFQQCNEVTNGVCHIQFKNKIIPCITHYFELQQIHQHTQKTNWKLFASSCTFPKVCIKMFYVKSTYSLIENGKILQMFH